MQAFLLPDEVAALTAIQDRLRTTRPSPRTAEAHLHDAVHDGLGAVIWAGQGITSTARDFAGAGESVRKAVAAS